jgi:hypothetical protein
MNGRLYRLTPAGGKPNHYTDSYASALAVLKAASDRPVGTQLANVGVGGVMQFGLYHVERIA